MPLNTLKKEERRSNEVEEEEEEEDIERAVRIRGRVESVVRSSNRPTIKILAESEVSDTVTEAPRDLVEASTVVNYEKQQLAELPAAHPLVHHHVLHPAHLEGGLGASPGCSGG